MNVSFDLGGADGFGPIEPPAEEPVFHEDWEKVVMTMYPILYRAGWYGLDSFRHGVELMDPDMYFATPYYEHWLHSMEHHGQRVGELDIEELDRRTTFYLENPDAPLPDHEQDDEMVAFIVASRGGFSPKRPSDNPIRFAVGDTVRLAVDAPRGPGHTRLARYVRGKVGTVIAHRGAHIYPDSAGNNLDEDPQHVYTVKFDSVELWGTGAEANTTMTIDVWDPYIEHTAGGKS
ncbi:nitrile hydratase subunit beta [Rhodococcoides fascians]|uniref:nitrile hydratase subunit beta n=1 Tax=Rhodococcoides fascians TaxID=1828 RepID=UPI00050CFA87|nr:nitrile hydratase subunit beta [Rhodococcus fascians]